jgi:hypothetical protein
MISAGRNKTINTQDFNLETWQVWAVVIAMLWELVWKGFALWRASRKGHTVWFVLMLVFDTVGILPITYLLVTNKSKKKHHKVALED